MNERVIRFPCGNEQIADQVLDICLYLLRLWGAQERIKIQKTKSEGKSVLEFRGDLHDQEIAQLMELKAGKLPSGYKPGAGKETEAKAAETETARLARRTVTEAEKSKARQLFEHAKKVADTRNYDYAIECFINGLLHWPDAVTEGHQPLRGCAVARMHAGGKKASFTDGMKYSMTIKDPVKAMLNAEWLYSRDTTNLGYMEGVLKNANKARCDDTVLWMGAIYREAAEAEKKASAKRYELLSEVYEELGDRCQARGETKTAIEAYERAASALDLQRRLTPSDNTLTNKLRDLSTKLTIVKGKYQTADSFRESLEGGESQSELHDRDRMVQGSDRLTTLIELARKDWEAHPNVPGKLFTLTDLLGRQENEEFEKQAIGLLVQEFKRTDNYQYKTRAEDIRRGQLVRLVRSAQSKGDAEAIKAARIELLRYELPVFAERVKKYPTDHRLRFEYAVRLFEAGKLDEAIPALQTARMDAKNRSRCDLYLGRAFYKKALYQQSLDILQEAIRIHEIPDDEIGKELLYWKARSEEAGGLIAQARNSYGQMLRIDYNFRDVLARLESLPKSQ